MTVNEAIEKVIAAGRGMHGGYKEIGKPVGPFPEDLGEQIAVGLYAIGRFLSGRHARADTDIAAQIVRAEIMAGRLPTTH